MDESEFYTGLVAKLYGPLRSADPDPEPYAAFIAACGEPALELGCGDGDPMLELRRRGIDVTGVDSSADMLDRCRERAAASGIEVELHHQRMQDLDLGRAFRSIYLAGPTFDLLPDDEAASAALAAIAAHLEPGGSALVPLFVPEPLPADLIGVARDHLEEDGTILRFTVTGEVVDTAARTLTRASRYDAVAPDGTRETIERDWLVHWFTQDGFRRLATHAGLTVAAILAPDATPAGPDDDVFVFWLTRPA